MVSFAGLSILIMENPKAGLSIFCLSIILSIASGYALMKFLPKFFVTRKFLVLEPPKSETPKRYEELLPKVKPGDVGQTCSTLRPVGSALFGSEKVEVVSEAEFLKKGESVEVVRVEGQKVVVRACELS